MKFKEGDCLCTPTKIIKIQKIDPEDNTYLIEYFEKGVQSFFHNTRWVYCTEIEGEGVLIDSKSYDKCCKLSNLIKMTELQIKEVIVNQIEKINQVNQMR